MGSHKLNEWREGQMFKVDHPDPKKNPFGHIVGRRIRRKLINGLWSDTEEILFIANAGDGADENMFDAFDAGYDRGVRAGREAAQREIRIALGLIQ